MAEPEPVLAAVPVFTFPMTPRVSRTPPPPHAFYKAAPEVWCIALDCTAALPPDATIADATTVARDRTDPTASADVLPTAGTTVTGALVRTIVQAGTPGHSYALDMQITLADALPSVYTETVMMAIL